MSILHNIPNELRLRPQWVCAGNDKVPINPTTGEAADPTDPSTWGTFEQACRAGKKHVGYVLSKDDPYACIDLDDPTVLKKVGGVPVLDPDPANVEAKQARHRQIIETAQSYCEVSQSGKGVHIFLIGSIPHGVRRDCVEVYSQDRYIICTGNVMNPLPIDDNQFLLDVLFKEMATTRKATLVESDAIQPDDDIIAMGRAADNGPKFQQLWDGAWEQNPLWPSQSEADFALMAMLCYYSKSNEQCRRLFRLSGLMRDKARRDKYLDYMIEKCRAKEPPPTDLAAIRNAVNETTHAQNVKPKPPRPQQEASRKPSPPDGPSGHHRPPASPPPERGDDGGSPRRKPAPPTSGKEPVAPAVVFPPGLVGQLAEYFFSSAIRPVREIALASALAFTAGICGRSYNVSGTGLNQYLVLLARTGSGKEAIASGFNAVVAAIRPTIPMADRFIGPATFASGQGLTRVLDERPCFVSVLGEVGHTIQQLSDPRINDAQRMLKKVLLDLYNKSGFNNVLQPSAYSDTTKNTKMIHAPCVTILGESTPDVFYGGLDTAQVLDGLLPRFSIIEYDGLRVRRNRNAFHPPSEELLNAIGELITLALTCQSNTTCHPVSLDADALNILDALDDYATDMINKSTELERHLWNRTHLKALKLAALIAVGCNLQNPVINAEAATWARDFALRDVSLIAQRFASGDVGEGQSKQEADMRAAFLDYRTMTTATRQQYKVPAKLLREANVVPYHYLRRRLRGVASYKNDRRGFNAAMDSMLNAMVKDQSLQLIDRKLAMETFDCTQPLYARGVTF